MSGVRGEPMLLEVRWTDVDGETPLELTDPVNVTITRGATLVMESQGVEADPDEAGHYVTRWTPTGGLGLHAATWSTSVDGLARSITTRFNVRSQRVMTVRDARAQDEALKDVAQYPAASILEALDVVTDEFERILGYSLTPLDEPAWPILPGQLPGRALGLSALPGDLRWAVGRRLVSLLLANTSNIPDRATSFSVDGGGTYALSTAGRAGAETGIPDVDAILKRHAFTWLGAV